MSEHKPVFAIDPGPVKSAWVWITREGIDGGIYDNESVLQLIEGGGIENLAIEMIASYGMPVGAEVFETCVWIGRFIQHSELYRNGEAHHLVYRKDVKMNLCGSMKAKDSNIRQALIDRFGPSKERAVGLKKSPGPLYGFKKDMWAALGVAVTWQDQNKYT